MIPKANVPGWMLDLARRFLDVEAASPCLDSRVIEYAFVLGRLLERRSKSGCCKALDVGCTFSQNFLAATLAFLGGNVYGLDLRPFRFEHPHFQFVRSDVRNTSFPDNFLDCIYAASTLEHIGLARRYGVTTEDLAADAAAVKEIRRICNPGGVFGVTVPYGKWHITLSLNRVYDRPHLLAIFQGWHIAHVAYWALNREGYWVQVAEQEAAEVCGGQGDCMLGSYPGEITTTRGGCN